MDNNLIGKIIPFLSAGATDEQSTCESCGAPKQTGILCRACAVYLVDIALTNVDDTFPDLAAGTETYLSAQNRRYYDHYEVCLTHDGQLVELGRGTMGITYKALDLHLGCPVALKIINTQFLEGSNARERLLREARTAAKLRHPNIASIFHLGLSDEHCYYSMEHIEGETLEDCIRREGALPVETTLSVAIQIAKALRVSHERNFIHRDIKPSNIMLVSGSDTATGEVTVKLIDFGLVKAVTDSASFGDLVSSQYFAGTPHFASPEQLESGTVDARSDIYSLGVCINYMLTGRVEASVAVQSANSAPKPLLELLASMLAADPARRPPSALDLLERLQKCQVEIRKGENEQDGNEKSLLRGYPFVWGLAAVLLVLLSAAFICFHLMNSPERGSVRRNRAPDRESQLLYAAGNESVFKQTSADNQRAIESFSKAIARSPDYAEAHAGLAIAYFHGITRFGAPMKQLELAQASAQQAVTIDPACARGYHALGAIRAFQNRSWDALAQLHKALEVDHDYLPAYREYAMLWCSVGQPQFGLPWAKASIEKEPTNSSSWTAAADACVDLLMDAQAEDYYHRCLQVAPSWLSAHCGLMHIHLLRGDFAQARRDYDLIQTIDPEAMLALNLKGQIELFSGNYVEAEKIYQQLLGINRTGLVNYYGGISYLSALGFLSRQSGNLAESERFLQEASTLHRDAEGGNGVYDLAAIYAIQGQTDKALASLRQAIESGWLDVRTMRLDPRFGSIHANPEFERLLVLLRKRVERMRAEAEKLCAKPPIISDYPVRPPPMPEL